MRNVSALLRSSVPLLAAAVAFISLTACRLPEIDEPDAAAASADAAPVAPALSCALDEMSCGGACVDAARDDHNCGGCGIACPGGFACMHGQCAPRCAPSEIHCGQRCVDVKASDVENCGSCGARCEDGLACVHGACALVCGGGTTKCGDATCAALDSDPRNCGACGVSCDAETEACVEGACEPLKLLTEFTGVVTNMPISELKGWSLCFSEDYTKSGTPLSTIAAQCGQGKIMLGCKRSGEASLLVAAYAASADVFYPTASGETHSANGVEFYFDPSSSLGFAAGGDLVSHVPCDVLGTPGFGGAHGDQRLCWHASSGALAAGFRCGVEVDVDGNASGAFERVVYKAP